MKKLWRKYEDWERDREDRIVKWTTGLTILYFIYNFSSTDTKVLFLHSVYVWVLLIPVVILVHLFCTWITHKPVVVLPDAISEKEQLAQLNILRILSETDPRDRIQIIRSLRFVYGSARVDKCLEIESKTK